MRALLAAASVVLFAACGGDGEGAGQPTSNEPRAIAERIGCTGLAEEPTDEIGVRDAYTCQVGGERVRILTFASADATRAFVDVAAEFGSRYVYGDGWAVEADSAPVVATVADKTGGQTR